MKSRPGKLASDYRVKQIDLQDRSRSNKLNVAGTDIPMNSDEPKESFKCFLCFGQPNSGTCRQCSGSSFICSSHPLVKRMQQIFSMGEVLSGERERQRAAKKDYLLLPCAGTDVINEESFSMQDEHSFLSRCPSRSEAESDPGKDGRDSQHAPEWVEDEVQAGSEYQVRPSQLSESRSAFDRTKGKMPGEFIDFKVAALGWPESDQSANGPFLLDNSFVELCPSLNQSQQTKMHAMQPAQEDPMQQGGYDSRIEKTLMQGDGILYSISPIHSGQDRMKGGSRQSTPQNELKGSFQHYHEGTDTINIKISAYPAKT